MAIVDTYKQAFYKTCKKHFRPYFLVLSHLFPRPKERRDREISDFCKNRKKGRREKKRGRKKLQGDSKVLSLSFKVFLPMFGVY